MIKQVLILLSLVIWFSNSFAQTYSRKNLHPESKDFVNISVKKLYSDSLSSTFAIWIKKEVKPHLHKYHTEVVTILDGKAVMTLGEKTIKVKKGDVIIIPKGTSHSVKTVSKKPLLVISVQSPIFIGKDRVWVN